ncbi:MarR family transcriptional regulator [Hyphomonas sp.]|jgi:DNA-binding MarR family transcriptional regulator|uniref:MarR family winged helix-turn-helix transcriptional regulator n=1 Tax=Hyphomonas sp. TaxID=87 RepID=UPI000C3DB436|nr:MarR family transcriptional regulator [Hyphomonas sp.]MAB10201.1 MarR family transcriptional regulator [Hyphomonas sp.]MAU68360.1 MarR family transcriptional regulator [Hyphomonas sp.]
MFFLKELPSRQTLERYSVRYPDLDVGNLEDALIMMRRASVLVRELEKYFDARGLSLLRFLILIVLDREPESDMLSFGEITERVDVSKPVMTRTLKALEEDGLIAVEGGDDKRVKHVRLTEPGKEILQQTLPGYYTLINAFMQKGEA